MENIGIYIEKSFENYIKNVESNRTLDSNVDILNLLKDMFSTFNLFTDKLNNLADIFIKFSTTLLIFVFIMIALYFLKAIGMYVISSKKKLSLSYLSFVPFGFFYMLGKAVGKTKIYGIEIDFPQFLLPLLLLTSIICPCFSLLSIILFVLSFFALLYKLYSFLVYSFRIPLLLLSIALPFLIPLFIFAIRNKE